MKLTKKVFLWIATVLLLLLGLGTLPQISGFFGLLASVILVPVEKWQLLIEKFMKKKIKAILAVVLVLAMLLTLPVVDTTKQKSEVSEGGASVASTSTSVTDSSTTTTTLTTTRKTTVTTRVPTTTKKITTTTKVATATKPPVLTDDVMVWIPTNGGTKYHCKSNCSKMIDPEYVTIEEAKTRGFTACGRCYK